MLSKNFKYNARLIGGTLAGSTLGFIGGNVPGAVLGGSLAYNYLR